MKKYEDVQRAIYDSIYKDLNKDYTNDIVKIGENVLELQAKLHTVVSEASKPIGISTQFRNIDVQPMSYATVRFQTKDHRGLIRIFVEFNREETNLIAYIAKVPEITDKSYLLMFDCAKNQKILLRPSVALDVNLLTKKQIAQGFDNQVWQPDHMFCMFQSTQGCSFNVRVCYVDEEEKLDRRKKIGQGTNIETKLRG